MSRTVNELAGLYAMAWAAHDANAVGALHTEDSVFHVHGLGDAASGTEAVRQLAAELFALSPDLHFEAKRVYLGSDHIALEYDMSGTAGQSFVCDGVDVIAVSDGLVARKDTYLDLIALERQIGPLPRLTTAAVVAGD
jgi:ketosteroid isomerase-like protein